MNDSQDYTTLLSHKNIHAIEQSLIHHLIFVQGKDPVETSKRDWFHAVAYVVRDMLTAQWLESMRSYYLNDAKRVYYLSMEFLMGRTLSNAIANLEASHEFKTAIENVGLSMEVIADFEAEAGLGNGGLGRLAACFLDSLASLDMPGFGYGIRYEYGLFRQKIEAGWQIEHPDNWLAFGNPWEFPRSDVLYRIRFGGSVQHKESGNQAPSYEWIHTQDVMAMAYDTPIPGYGGRTVNNLRLWSATSTDEFDLRYFNEGNYIRAVEQKTMSENISKVLYPDDTTHMGRELRLKQEYFFVSASLQDIIAHFLKDQGDLDNLPNEVAIQLNDTHPAIAIPEMMRLLIDEHDLSWLKAWDITRRCFSYTNHTLMPEALETWPVNLIGRLLPRHLTIIYEINRRFLEQVSEERPGDMALIRRISLIDEDHGQQIRMSHLAIVGSHKVNGVAKLHSDLMQATIFKDFAALYPERFMNITNGVTPRRWIHVANKGLSSLISEAIGGEWIKDLDRLKDLEPYADDSQFRAQFRKVKHEAKLAWIRSVGTLATPSFNTESLFDVQIKRMHEYKRQLLNVLHVVSRYQRILEGKDVKGVRRTIIIGGKAAPAYHRAKLIIKLIHDVAATLRLNPQIDQQLRLHFLEDYDVTKAMILIPATDLSEQISMAGTEASGTSNMKMVMNGALTIGTLDGANIEIRDQVGKDQFFLFGATAKELKNLHQAGYDPKDILRQSPELQKVLTLIGGGHFSPDDRDRFKPLVDGLLEQGDPYSLVKDFSDYIRAQDDVDNLWADQEEWSRRAILNIARSGHFSSDRAIKTYAEEVWGIQPRP
jgi:starch phosphorylase